MKEAAVFTRNDASVGASSVSTKIINNTIIGVTIKDVQAAGFEIGGIDTIIQDNFIRNCGGAAIDLTDFTNTAIVANNIIRDCVQDQTNKSGFGGITIRATDNIGLPQDITVHNNNIRDTLGNAQYGIRVWRPTGTDIPARIRIIDNDVAASGATENLSYGAPIGNGCVVAGNVGHNSFSPVMGRVTLTAAVATQAITGVGFVPRLVTVEAVYVSASSASRSSGARARDGVTGSRCVYSYTDNTNAHGGFRDGDAVNLVDSGGSDVFSASITSFEADGFTFDKTVATIAPTVVWTAYP
tara:strand:- start:68 stop:961 length:894 start_codon:yes stop_codon:yes gene_type:complete